VPPLRISGGLPNRGDRAICAINDAIFPITAVLMVLNLGAFIGSPGVLHAVGASAAIRRMRLVHNGSFIGVLSNQSLITLGEVSGSDDPAAGLRIRGSGAIQRVVKVSAIGIFLQGICRRLRKAATQAALTRRLPSQPKVQLGGWRRLVFWQQVEGASLKDAGVVQLTVSLLQGACPMKPIMSFQRWQMLRRRF